MTGFTIQVWADGKVISNNETEQQCQSDSAQQD